MIKISDGEKKDKKIKRITKDVKLTLIEFTQYCDIVTTFNKKSHRPPKKNSIKSFFNNTTAPLQSSIAVTTRNELTHDLPNDPSVLDQIKFIACNNIILKMETFDML